MSFRIEFDTDNASFEDYEYAVRQILMKICDQVSYGHRNGVIGDVNGNIVGGWEAD